MFKLPEGHLVNKKKKQDYDTSYDSTNPIDIELPAWHLEDSSKDNTSDYDTSSDSTSPIDVKLPEWHLVDSPSNNDNSDLGKYGDMWESIPNTTTSTPGQTVSNYDAGTDNLKNSPGFFSKINNWLNNSSLGKFGKNFDTSNNNSNLNTITKAFERKEPDPNEPSWGDVLSNSAKSSLYSTLEGFENLPRVAYKYIAGNPDNSVMDWLDNQHNYLDQKVQGYEDKLKDVDPYSSKGTAKLAIEGAGQVATVFLPGGALGKLGKVAGLGEKAVTALQMLPFAEQAGGNYAAQAEKEGATTGQQLAYGLAGGALEGLTEAIPFKGISKLIGGNAAEGLINNGANTLIGKYGKLGLEYIKNIGKEAAQEAIIDPLTGLAKKAIYDPNMKLTGEGGVLDTSQMAQDAWGGGAMSILISGLGLGKNTLSHKLASHMIENNVEPTPKNVNVLQNQVNNDIQAFGVPEVNNNEMSQANSIQPQEQFINTLSDTDTTINTGEQPTMTPENATQITPQKEETVPSNINIPEANNSSVKVHGEEIKEALITPQTIEPGQKYSLKNLGDVIIKNNDGKLITAQHKSGQDIKIGIDGFNNLNPQYLGNTITLNGQEVPSDKENNVEDEIKNSSEPATQKVNDSIAKIKNDEIPDNIRKIPTRLIGVNPQRFQFKEDMNSNTGTSNELKGTDTFDHTKAGVVTIWQDRNGKNWVVNGHHRVELANRTKTPYVNAMVLKEKEGITDKQAREIGALQNIGEGKGTSKDAAQVFRDGGYNLDDIKNLGLSTTDKFVKQGYNISKLNDRAWNKVVNKQIKDSQASMIGEAFPADNEKNIANQNAAVDYIQSEGHVSDQELKEAIDQIKTAPVTGQQIDMLGGSEFIMKNNFKNKVKLISKVKSILGSEKSAFSNVLNKKKASLLNEKGNVLNDTANKKQLDLVNQGLLLVDLGKNKAGDPINDILNNYAIKIEQGMSNTRAAEGASKEIVDLVDKGDYLNKLNNNQIGGQQSLLGGLSNEKQGQGVTGNKTSGTGAGVQEDAAKETAEGPKREEKNLISRVNANNISPSMNAQDAFDQVPNNSILNKNDSINNTESITGNSQEQTKGDLAQTTPEQEKKIQILTQRSEKLGHGKPKFFINKNGLILVTSKSKSNATMKHTIFRNGRTSTGHLGSKESIFLEVKPGINSMDNNTSLNNNPTISNKTMWKKPSVTANDSTRGTSLTLDVQTTGYSLNPSTNNSISNKNNNINKAKKKSTDTKAYIAPDRKTLNSSGTGETLPRKQIIDSLIKELDIPTRVGRMNKRRASGIYKERPEVIRTKLAEDIPTLSHEIGHHLDKLYRINDLVKNNSKFNKEIMDLGEEQAKLQKLNTEEQRSEGIAEFVRKYLTGEDLGNVTFTNMFGKILDGKLIKALNIFRKHYMKYQNADAGNRVLAHVDFGDSRKTIKEKAQEKIQDVKNTSFDKFYTTWVDELRPLENLVKKGTTKSIWSDPFRMAWLFRGWSGKAIGAIKYGVYNYNENGRLIEMSKGLNEILKPIKADDMDNFRKYIIAKRVIEKEEQGIRTGFDLMDAEKVVEKYDKNKEFVKAHKALQTYQDSILKRLVDGGLMSEEQYNKIKELNKDYVPFYRVLDNEEGTSKYTGSTFGNIKSPVRKMRGSNASIVDPIESIVKNTYYFTNLAERNLVSQSLVKFAEENGGMGKFVENVTPKFSVTKFELSEIKSSLENVGFDIEDSDMEETAKIFRPIMRGNASENIITVSFNGKPKLYQLEPDIYRAVMGLDRESSNLIFRVANLATKTLRAGAVLNPEFAFRNLVRDALGATVYSKYNFIPVLDTIKGLSHVLKKDEMYQLWLNSGGAQSDFISMDRDYLAKGVKNVLSRGKPKEILVDFLKNPLEPLRYLSSLSEEATRLGHFAKGLNKEGNSREGISEVGLSTRDLTTDFQRSGTAGKNANKLIAFFNATVQGQDKMIRTFRNPKTRTAALIKALVSITLPSLVLWAMYHDNDKIKELPLWRKDLFWNIPTQNHVISIPKPFELGIIFGSLSERILDHFKNGDPKAMKSWASDFLGNMLPGGIPAVVQPMVEWWANKSFFTGLPLENEGDQSLPAYQRYSASTSLLAKNLGKFASNFTDGGLSPKKIDNTSRDILQDLVSML